MINSFVGIGRLTTDPERLRKGNSIRCEFTLAINEFYKKGNDLEKKTHYIPCWAKDRLAEICLEFLRKGSQVGIKGPLVVVEHGEDIPDFSTLLMVEVEALEFLSTGER